MITSLEKRKLTCLERYGVDNPAKCGIIKQKIRKTCLEKYGAETYLSSNNHKSRITEIEEKKRKTCLEKYGVEVSSKSNMVKEKNKNTCLERYGEVSYTHTEEYKNRHNEIQEKSKRTCLERYGVENYIYTDEFKQKEYLSKKKNKTFNSSSIEKEFELYLKEKNIEYKTQYKSELYPFSCDFYLPQYELYIEINAHWTHGKHPYKSKDLDDQKKIEYWESKNTKFYDNAIKTWTIRDVEKRKIAKQNNLNYLEVFTKNMKVIIKELEKFIY